MLLKKMMVAVALMASMIGGPVAAAEVTGLPDFTRIVASEGRAVVNIGTTRTERGMAGAGLPNDMLNDPFFDFFRRFAPPQLRERQVSSLGSGFIISPDGYVMTNAHVVTGADEITVTLTDKREFKARLIGADERTDVALLKIQGSNLPVVRMGKSAELRVGEWVLAIGSPFGFDNSVTAGIVSALNRQLPEENFVPFIQTDAAVNPGNSGGPLFNLNGEVVGINSQIFSRSGGFMGISFAVPIDIALGVSDQIKVNGKVDRGRIGVSLQSLTRELAQSFGLTEPQGALINAVDANGPAARAGLHVGDVITRANGQPVSSPVDLQRLVGMARPGTRFALKVWRDDASLDISVVSGPMDESATRQASAEPEDKPASSGALGKAGLVVTELNALQLKQLGVKYGLLVRGVNEAAARAGLAAGDVIVGIGDTPLRSRKQLEAEVRSDRPLLPLQVMRNGVTLFVPLPLRSKG